MEKTYKPLDRDWDMMWMSGELDMQKKNAQLWYLSSSDLPQEQAENELQ
jgi:hypothetical protein